MGQKYALWLNYARGGWLVTFIQDMCPIKLNIKELQKQFNIGSCQTMENHVDYLKQAYLLIGVHKCSTKSCLRIHDATRL